MTTSGDLKRLFTCNFDKFQWEEYLLYKGSLNVSKLKGIIAPPVGGSL